MNAVECRDCRHNYYPATQDALCPHRPLGVVGPSLTGCTTPLPSVDQEPVYDQVTGGQKAGEYRADRLPMKALLAICHLLKEGAERHKDEDPENPKWLATPVREHGNRAMIHLMAYFNGDRSEKHLVHAACRLLFAVHCDIVLGEKSSTHEVV